MGIAATIGKGLAFKAGPRAERGLRPRGAAPRHPGRRPAAAGGRGRRQAAARAGRRRGQGDPRGDREPRPLRRRPGVRHQRRRPGDGGGRDPGEHHRARPDPVPAGRGHRAPAGLRARRTRGSATRSWPASSARTRSRTWSARRSCRAPRWGSRPRPPTTRTSTGSSPPRSPPSCSPRSPGSGSRPRSAAGSRWSAGCLGGSADAYATWQVGRYTDRELLLRGPGGRPPARPPASLLSSAERTSRRLTRNQGLAGAARARRQARSSSRCSRTSASAQAGDLLAAA